MADYKKEWFLKSQIDYFSAFLNLWQSCNSWYNFHYGLANDREHINKLKTDFSNANKLYKEFKNLFTGADSKEQKSLYSNIEILHYCLVRKNYKPDNGIKYELGFENCLIDFANKTDDIAYFNCLLTNARGRNGKIKPSVIAFDLGDIVLINDTEKIFAGLIEIIYQIRCALVHGDLDPKDDSHDIVKYCYLILYDLMKSFCS